MKSKYENKELYETDDEQRKIVSICSRLLGEAGISLDETQVEALDAYGALLREWNPYASLVSQRDMEKLWASHVADALSLAPWVRRLSGEGGVWLDIGSGGGFPLIPVRVVLPDIRVAAIERSQRAVAFLRRAVEALGLENVTVIEGEFPRACAEIRPAVITARAVERQEKILGNMRGFLNGETTFLCQSGKAAEKAAGMFHVEQVRDSWSEQGIRRGNLYLIR